MSGTIQRYMLLSTRTHFVTKQLSEVVIPVVVQGHVGATLGERPDPVLSTCEQCGSLVKLGEIKV